MYFLTSSGTVGFCCRPFAPVRVFTFSNTVFKFGFSVTASTASYNSLLGSGAGMLAYGSTVVACGIVTGAVATGIVYCGAATGACGIAAPERFIVAYARISRSLFCGVIPLIYVFIG